jgi:hypothetical protein
MNSTNSHSTAGRLLGLFLTLVLSASAYAGPGPQYWASLGRPYVQSGTPAKQAALADGVVCTGSGIVAITTTMPGWPNGRGPSHAVQTGIKRECSSCSVTATVMRPSLPNGRGPLQALPVAGRHDCGSQCVVSNAS